MIDVIKDTLLDGIKLIPFLFAAFLIIELIEHKIDSKKIISNNTKYGPFIGGILGAFPQCGFSVLGTNLYATRIITLGTLISIYLSTSDEMIPLMLSNNVDISIILKILSIKVIVGMLFGFIIDLIISNKKEINIDICEDDNCDCKHSIIKSSIHHTLKIFIFILLVSFILNIILYYFGEDSLKKLFLTDSIFSSFISSLIGLIPNCASSVLLTNLYINGALNLGALLSGLLTGSGVGILVLFKVNKNMKENVLILFTIYFIGVIVGILFNLIGIIL